MGLNMFDKSSKQSSLQSRFFFLAVDSCAGRCESEHLKILIGCGCSPSCETDSNCCPDYYEVCVFSKFQYYTYFILDTFRGVELISPRLRLRLVPLPKSSFKSELALYQITFN